MGMFDSIMQQRRPTMQPRMPTQFVPPPPIMSMGPMTESDFARMPQKGPVTESDAARAQGGGQGGMMGSIMKMFGGGAPGGAPMGVAPGAPGGGGMDLSKILMMMGGM